MGWLEKPGDNIHTWTFTKNGIYGDGEYYLRVSGCDTYIGEWNPNLNTGCTIANSGQRVNQQRILDQGFLKLSLFGLVDPSDWRIKKSLEVVNKNIRVETPRGAGWYRYSYDAYGEEKEEGSGHFFLVSTDVIMSSYKEQRGKTFNIKSMKYLKVI